jgi:hypothetical protein
LVQRYFQWRRNVNTIARVRAHHACWHLLPFLVMSAVLRRESDYTEQNCDVFVIRLA